MVESLVAALALGAGNATWAHDLSPPRRPHGSQERQGRNCGHFPNSTRDLSCVRFRNTERVLTNAGVERLLEVEAEKGSNLQISDIFDQVAGVYPGCG